MSDDQRNYKVRDAQGNFKTGTNGKAAAQRAADNLGPGAVVINKEGKTVYTAGSDS